MDADDQEMVGRLPGDDQQAGEACPCSVAAPLARAHVSMQLRGQGSLGKQACWAGDSGGASMPEAWHWHTPLGSGS